MAAPKGNEFWKEADINKMGRPPKYDNPNDMLNKIREYFLSYLPCNEGTPKPVLGFKPTVTGLSLYLGFSDRKSLYEYRDKYKDFSSLIKKALTYIEMNYEQMLESKSSTGAIFALKNMGWKDKKEINNLNPEISIEIVKPED